MDKWVNLYPGFCDAGKFKHTNSGFQNQIFKFCINTQLDRGLDSTYNPVVWVVNSDRARWAAHAYIGHSSQRVVKSRTRGIWSWKLWFKNVLFPNMSVLSPIGPKRNFYGLKRKPGTHGLAGRKILIYCVPIPISI